MANLERADGPRNVTVDAGAADGAAGGALRAWRERVRRDPSSLSLFDALHGAACADANAIEATRAGLPAIAQAWYADAAERLRGRASTRAVSAVPPVPAGGGIDAQ
jgi:hypothetical protein